ncbi:MAG: DUF748 domain-containing protein [Flavobacteriaceae bacterium]|nr:DUF748 domain-containing protein [Flavobacteriaceae bacterium]
MKNKIFKILLASIVTIIILLLLLPGFIKRYAINNSKEFVGRQLQIDKLKYNYFTSTVKVFGFKMLEQNEQDNFVSFDTLIINLKPLQLFKDKIEIEEFFLKGLDINVTMKDSLFNFDDLIAFHATEEDTINKNVEEGKTYKYSLSNLELNNANFHFNNQDIEHITNIENLSFMVPFIGWDQEEKSNADVKFNFPRGGYFESKLNINPIDGEFDADLTISDLYLDPFYKYVAEYAEINSFSGLVNLKIHFEGNTNEAVKSIVSGQVKVTNFEMTDTNNKIFLSVKNMNAAIQNFDYFNNSYIIDSLNISDSYTFFQLDSITNNFFHIFKLDSYTEASETEDQTVQTNDSSETVETEAKSNIYYAINHLEINKGVLDYTDNLTGKPFNYHLSEIEINTDSIISDSEWVDIQSEMLLNNRGTLKADFGINPSNPLYTKLDLSIEKFLLSDINIYSNHYTGHTILEGDMYYYSNSIITNGDIASENKLLIKNVSLNNTEGGLYSLPLKFALFLLKDKNGDVNLDIPVKGDLNDPTLNVSKIVWSTFKNLIVKIASNPGKLLAGLVGGDPKDIEEITFSYLDSIPSEKNIKQLDKLLELEQKKEGIKIEMVYYIDEQLQKEAIAKDEAGKLYFKETKKDYLKDEKGFETFLLSKTATDSLDVKQSYMAIANQSLVDSIAINNSKLLISNTEKYLRTSQDSTQINILFSDPKAPENTGAIPTLKVNFSLLDNVQITN